VRRAAATVSGYVAAQHPGRITTEWVVAKRQGKIFLDYNQNSRGKTVASVYSARPTPWAGVSLPFTWEEIPDIYPADFNIENVPARLAKTGDIWVDIMKKKSDMAALLEQ
jgi:bifunctional non-homologous end joining protein LigD